VTRTALGSLERGFRGVLRSDAETLARLGGDGSHLVGRPLAGAAPADTDDVVSLVRWSRAHRIPLVPRGAGTSLDGESVPADGAVVVDLSGWRTVHDLSAAGRWARVGPGLVNRELQEAVRSHGLFFPPNPGSWETCTVGGNVGTNASGPRSYRYGPTRAWVREIEVVLGTGELVRVGTRAEKRSVGPDLLSLLIGSEGTLGITTEVTVRLAPLPPLRRGLVVPLPAPPPLGDIAARLRAAGGCGLSAVEYLDAVTAAVFPEAGATEIPPGPLLLIEIEAEDEEEADRRTVRTARVLRDAGVRVDPIAYPDADRLWSLRGQASRLLDRRFGSRIREDVAVPVPQIDELLARVARIARAEHAPLYVFAHLGEGSLHPNFGVDPTSPTASRIRAALYTATLALGGTISSEHGVGRLKREFLERELGPTSVRLLHAVKRACDPDGILNPGVLYPSAAGRRSSRSPSVGGAGRVRPASPIGARRRPRVPARRRPGTPRTRAGSR
jgi:D-lactate dehydrogenase